MEANNDNSAPKPGKEQLKKDLRAEIGRRNLQGGELMEKGLNRDEATRLVEMKLQRDLRDELAKPENKPEENPGK